MRDEWNDQEKVELHEVMVEFTTWLNKRIAERRVRVQTMAEMIANLYLRMRMYLEEETAVRYMGSILVQVQRRIDGGLRVEMPGGDQDMPFYPAEVLNNDEGLRDMIADASKELTDDEAERFFQGMADPGSVS